MEGAVDHSVITTTSPLAPFVLLFLCYSGYQFFVHNHQMRLQKE